MVSAFTDDLRPCRYDVVSPSGDIIGYAKRVSRVNNADLFEQEHCPRGTSVVADTLDAGLIEAFNAGRGALVKIWVLHIYDDSFDFKYIKSVRNFLKNGTS